MASQSTVAVILLLGLGVNTVDRRTGELWNHLTTAQQPLLGRFARLYDRKQSTNLDVQNLPRRQRHASETRV